MALLWIMNGMYVNINQQLETVTNNGAMKHIARLKKMSR